MPARLEATIQSLRVHTPGQGYARFLSALTVAAAGASVGVGVFTFSAPTERWLGFGVGAALVAVVLAAFAVRGRGVVQRLLDLPVLLVSVWLIVATRAVESAGAGSSPHSIKWLNLSAGAMLLGAGLFALFLHEWTVERDLRRASEFALKASPRPVRAAPPNGSAVPELTLEDRYVSAIPRSAG